MQIVKNTTILFDPIILNCYLVMMICVRFGAAEAGDLRYFSIN